MELNQKTGSNVVASSGVQGTSSFNIARTPHMFNILSSGLYSDKVAAVLREIGCNAMDAHIMGNVPDKPFQVKLPSTLDRTFYVKDWGPGLDDREVRELYTTYGWSSKQQNNDVTGAFGLGSKSPFAYTMSSTDSSDGFTVTAVKNGVKRIYTCHIGDDGAPTISKLFEGPADADWPHGVMVTFPVQESDIREFHLKARMVYRWFKVQPELLGIDQALRQLSFRFKGDGFALVPESDHFANAPGVVTGNVRYPINTSRLGELTPVQSAMLNANVHLFMPIGSVLMTPSREELQYTDSTKRNILAALDAAATSVGAQLNEDLSQDDLTAWEWFKCLHDYLDGLPYSLTSQLDDLLKFANVDEDRRTLISKAFTDKSARLPNWAGDGKGIPDTWYERDPNTGFRIRNDKNQYVLISGARNSARVWMYQALSNRDGIRRQELIGGRIPRRNGESVPAALAYNAEVGVFYSDASHADARVRAAIRNNEVEVAILVVAGDASEDEYAKKFAEKLCSTDGIEGLPCAAVSTLAVPDSVAEARERAKASRLSGPLQKFSDEEVRVFNLDGTFTTKLMGDLLETECYYLTSTKPQEPRNGTFRCFGPDEKDTELNFSGYWGSEVMKSIQELQKLVPMGITGAVIVRSEATARRLKFTDQKIQPLMQAVRKHLNEPANVAVIRSQVDLSARMPNIRLDMSYYADDWGILGVLGHLYTQNKPFAMLFKRTFDGTPLYHTVIELIKTTIDAAANRAASSASATPKVVEAVQLLRNQVSRTMAPELLSASALTASEFRGQVSEWNAVLGFMDENRLLNAVNSDTRKAMVALEAIATAANLGKGSTAPIFSMKL